MYEIRSATAEEMLAHAGELFAEHWDEIALNKRVMVLKPDAERYLATEQNGMLLALAAYQGDEIVGYSVNFIMPHMHYADLVIASNDLLFVSAAHRTSRLGLQLIRETERVAKERGAALMLWHAKENTALSTLMQHRRYKVQDIIYSKEL
jgi:predicted GNAT superfamily acetyltransferase